ncbi:hypothetical protein [Pseudomonas thivervalensis]|uniref:hypothetical protein n=1 Tax=Pseudomonas thivervalensis TaxID=86265 RepID=UPI00069FC1FA|nr:hypothetical protein [Pseudomonas thivervalensis]
MGTNRHPSEREQLLRQGYVNMMAIIVLLMALTPLAVGAEDRGLREGRAGAGALDGSVLMVGFGQFGQIVSQHVLALGFYISIIILDPRWRGRQ